MSRPLIDGYDNRFLAGEVRDSLESVFVHLLDVTEANMEAKPDVALLCIRSAFKDTRKAHRISSLIAEGKYAEAMGVAVSGQEKVKP